MSWSHPKLIIPIHDIALLLQGRNSFSNHGKVLVCLSNDVEGMTIDNSKNNPQSMMYESGCNPISLSLWGNSTPSPRAPQSCWATVALSSIYQLNKTHVDPLTYPGSYAYALGSLPVSLVSQETNFFLRPFILNKRGLLGSTSGEFPNSPVVRTWHSHSWGLGLNPSWGTMILQAMWCSQTKREYFYHI